MKTVFFCIFLVIAQVYCFPDVDLKKLRQQQDEESRKALAARSFEIKGMNLFSSPNLFRMIIVDW